MTTGSPPPTLDEIEQALDDWFYRENAKSGNVVLKRLASCLRSGEYALISRADREDVLAMVDEIDGGNVDARELLKLEQP